MRLVSHILIRVSVGTISHEPIIIQFPSRLDVWWPGIPRGERTPSSTRMPGVSPNLCKTNNPFQSNPLPDIYIYTYMSPYTSGNCYSTFLLFIFIVFFFFQNCSMVAEQANCQVLMHSSCQKTRGLCQCQVIEHDHD